MNLLFSLNPLLDNGIGGLLVKVAAHLRPSGKHCRVIHDNLLWEYGAAHHNTSRKVVVVFDTFVLQNKTIKHNNPIAQSRALERIMWTKPTAQDVRFGFEVTMYIAAR